MPGYDRAVFPGPGVWTFSCASSKRPTGEQKTAQGFSPGNDTHKEIALKGRPNGIDYNVYICCCMQWLSHHRKFSYQEELRELLKRHRVAFDERYLWE